MSKFIKEEIPFLDYVVSSENFDSTPDYENFNVVFKKENDAFSIKFKNNLPANMYYYVLDGKYAYCFNEELFATFLKEKGVELTINDVWQDYQNEKRKHDGDLKHNKYNEIERICMYDSLSLKLDGFEKTDITDMFTVPIREAGDNIRAWMSKYSKLVKENHDMICAELSSGLDTRALTYFWKDCGVNNIYTKDDKDEVPIVQELHEKFFPNIPLNIGKKSRFIFDDEGNKIGESITISGKGMDVLTIRSRYQDPDFYANVICYRNFNHLIKYICPYLDRDFLKIQQEKPAQLKMTLQFLMASDKMSVTYKSLARQVFVFNDYVKKAAHELLIDWGFITDESDSDSEA